MNRRSVFASLFAVLLAPLGFFRPKPKATATFKFEEIELPGETVFRFTFDDGN